MSLSGTILTLLLTLVTTLVLSHFSRPVTNYSEAAGPLFSGSYAAAPAPAGDSFKVVSWNIKQGARVETAISELQTVDELQDAAVLLLQEMDEGGVERIAQALDYNYVYYPASRDNERNLGNAVLSRWVIEDSVKIVLPHASPTTQERRIAVGALLDVEGEQVAVYSVHTELPILTPSQRREQLGYLADRLAATPACTIVGGDFNTATAGSAALVDETMASASLKPLISEQMPTLKLGLFRFTLDHLYSNGATALNAGAWQETAASDHFPLWVVLDRCS